MNPPLLPTSPFWNLLEWIVHPLDLLERNAARYGDSFAIRLGSFPPFTFFSDPQAIEQIFTASPNQFESGRTNSILRRMLGEHSLMLLDGERHRQQRHLLMPPFHGERMRAYAELMVHLTKALTQQWTVGRIFGIRPAMQQISMQVILQAVFGLTEGERYHQIRQTIQDMLDQAMSRFGFASNFFALLQRDFGAWSPGGRFIRTMRKLDQLLYAEIAERRQQFDSDRTDILTLLLLARDQNGEPMSDIELRDELITMLVAGHETTATALTWALYWVHSLPHVKAKLLAELDHHSNADPSTIAKLPYLNAVCCETLRIYPVGFIAEIRVATAPITIMGYQFERDSFLVPCIYLVHHRSDLYPEPKQFKPERFLERQFSPYEFLPFGGSNRRCIGAAFALFEMKLVLATILQRYQLELAESRPVQPVRRGVTIAPNSGIKMRLIQTRTQTPSSQLATVD